MVADQQIDTAPRAPRLAPQLEQQVQTGLGMGPAVDDITALHHARTSTRPVAPFIQQPGMSQDGLASFEPAYVDELAAIMAWAFDYVQRSGDDPDAGDWPRDENGGSVYLRLSTRPLQQLSRTIDAAHGQEIVDGEMLYREIRMHTPGDEVDLRIEREGKERTIEVALGEYSQQAIAREFDIKFPELFQVKPGETPRVFRASPDRLLNWVSVDRKYIGVRIQPVDGELAEFFGVEDGAGLFGEGTEVCLVQDGLLDLRVYHRCFLLCNCLNCLKSPLSQDTPSLRRLRQLRQ